MHCFATVLRLRGKMAMYCVYDNKMGVDLSILNSSIYMPIYSHGKEMCAAAVYVSLLTCFQRKRGHYQSANFIHNILRLFFNDDNGVGMGKKNMIRHERRRR